ncbi:MAG: restriction endonuclease subunit S [Planctomycetota bacterium]
MWNIVLSSQAGNRWDAEHYDPAYLEVESRLSKLEYVELAEIATDIRCGPFGSAIHKEDYRNVGVPLIRVADTSGPFVSSNDLVFIDTKLARELARHMVGPGDLVVSQRGTIAQFAMVTEEYEQWITSANLISILRSARADFGYLLAFLNSRVGLSQILRLQSGQVQPKIITDDVKSIRIHLPNQDTQIAIGDLVQRSYQLLRRSEALYAKAEALLLSELEPDDPELSYQPTYTQSFSQVRMSRRLDAEYAQPKYQQAMAALGRSGRTIGSVTLLARRRFEPRPREPFQYIEIGTIGLAGSIDSTEILGEDAPSRAQWIVRANDVITSTVRPIRRLSALIEPEQDGYVCSSGFVVLRPTAIEPEVLLVYLRLPIVCEILDLHTSASMYPAISPTDLLGMPVSIPSDRARSKMVKLVQESRQSRCEAERLVEEAKRRVDEIVLGESNERQV